MTSSPSPTPNSPGSGPATTPSGIPLVGVARLDAMSAALARNWWLVALRGVIAILFGAVAFIAPGAFVLSLVLFFAAYMLVDGIFVVVGAVRAAQRHERWGFLLLKGLVDIVVGVAAVVYTTFYVTGVLAVHTVLGEVYLRKNVWMAVLFVVMLLTEGVSTVDDLTQIGSPFGLQEKSKTASVLLSARGCWIFPPALIWSIAALMASFPPSVCVTC